ncbi:MAG: hypothetical protein IPK73_20920 [Candidatus Obscuribacter sp.]|nr:hypothetical protein [Candidatus Obscuribacter sp.]
MTHRSKKRGTTGNTAEVPVVLLILFGIFAFPLIDIIALALAYSNVWFIAFQSAAAASTQTDFTSSLSATEKKTSEFNGNGFTSMLKMTPLAGYRATGTDLFIDAVDFMDASKSQTIGPNIAVPPPIDLTNRFYQISAESSYEVKPFVDLHAVPFLSSVPALGIPITLSAKVKRCAEFPQGLVRGPAEPGSAPASSAQATPATSFASPIQIAGQTNEPWNRTNIYEEIEASGKKIVDHAVVQVNASNPDWTGTGLIVQPGQTIWYDYRKDLEWPVKGTRVGANGQVNTSISANIGRRSESGSITASFRKTAFGYYPPARNHNLVGAINPNKSFIMAQFYDFATAPPDEWTNQFSTDSIYKYPASKTGEVKLGYWNIEPVIFGTRPETGPEVAESILRSRYTGYKLWTGHMIVRVIVTN